MAITAEKLLKGIESRGLVAASKPLQSDQNILSFADDIISSRVISLLESVNQEFFVYKSRVPLIGGETSYPIPYRAVGRGIRDLGIMDYRGLNYRDIRHLGDDNSAFDDGAGNPSGFVFESDRIRISPTPSANTSDILVFTYRLPPNKLCKLQDAMVVASVGPDSVTVISENPNYLGGMLVDFIQARSGSTIYAYDVPILGVAGPTLTFAADAVPSELQVGDYICMAGYSPVINFIPNECYSYIESLITYRLLQSQGDYEAVASLKADIDTEEKNIRQLLEPRMDGDVTIICNNYGLVRGNRMRFTGWRGF